MIAEGAPAYNWTIQLNSSEMQSLLLIINKAFSPNDTLDLTTQKFGKTFFEKVSVELSPKYIKFP